MGATFIHRTVNNYSIPLIDTIKFYLGASEIVGNKSIRSQLDKFDNCNQNDLFLEGCQKLNYILARLVEWLVTYHDSKITLAELVTTYKDSYRDALKNLEHALPQEDFEQYNSKHERLVSSGFAPEVAKILAISSYMTLLFENIWISKQSGTNMQNCSQCHQNLIDSLNMSGFCKNSLSIKPKNRWDNELVIHSLTDIRKGLCEITIQLLKSGNTSLEQISQIAHEDPEAQRLIETMLDTRKGILSPSAVAVIARILNSLNQRLLK